MTVEREGLTAAVSVLIIDDDPVARAQLAALAKAAGYTVNVAEHGREAWEVLQFTRVPMVISDWYMPEMDGVDLCRRIRARHDAPYVYFILITARGGKQQYLAGMEAGADDFIAKPVDPDELRARLTVGWVSAITAAAALRTWWRLGLGRRTEAPEEALRGVRLTVVGIGLAWGFGAAAAIPELSLDQAALILVILAGILGGATGTLVGDRRCFHYLLLTVLTPLPAGLLALGHTRTHII